MFDTRNIFDHAEIRAWVEERGGRPAVGRGPTPHDDVSNLRFMFGEAAAAAPGEAGGIDAAGTDERFEPLDWDEWFRRFEAENLALWVQDRNADGEVSRYYEMVIREAYPDAHEHDHVDLDKLREAGVPHKDTPSKGPQDGVPGHYGEPNKGPRDL